MIVSHTKKFIMLLPWKTASQTAALRLASFQESSYNSSFDFNPYLNRVIHQHLTCADLTCLPESRLGYFLASFVRNPYDRVYSGFRQLLKDIREQTQLSFPYSEPWIRDHVMKQLADNSLQLSQAQFQFDRWLDLVGDDQIYEAGRNSNFPLHPCHYWTHSGGKQVVDFIGRVENFETDFRKFLSLVNIDIDHVPTGNANVVELEGTAGNNPFGYRYVDRMASRSIEKINRLFKRDFEIFGYERITGSKVNGVERAAHPMVPASDSSLPLVSPSLFNVTPSPRDLFFRQIQDLHRREAQILSNEAELRWSHKLFPVRIYKRILNPVKKMLGRQANSHVEQIKPA